MKRETVEKANELIQKSDALVGLITTLETTVEILKGKVNPNIKVQIYQELMGERNLLFESPAQSNTTKKLLNNILSDAKKELAESMSEFKNLKE